MFSACICVLHGIITCTSYTYVCIFYRTYDPYIHAHIHKPSCSYILLHSLYILTYSHAPYIYTLLYTHRREVR